MTESTGRVVEVMPARCRVRLDDGADIDCEVAQRLRRGRRVQRNVVVVGDRVVVGGESDAPIVTEVRPRTNEFDRPAPDRPGLRHVIAANVDLAVIVVAVARPEARTGFVDRLLVAANLRDIPALVVANKLDLVDEPPDWVGDYPRVGIDLVATSVVDERGIEEFRRRLTAGVSVVVGPSGVGKSSLMNSIESGLDLATGDVSDATNKGRHTTTSARLVHLAGGGAVVDTPGVRAFGIDDAGPTEVAAAYPEFDAYRGACRFNACTHRHEPSCAIRDAVGDGRVLPWRYENYVRIVEDDE